MLKLEEFINEWCKKYIEFYFCIGYQTSTLQRKVFYMTIAKFMHSWMKIPIGQFLFEFAGWCIDAALLIGCHHSSLHPAHVCHQIPGWLDGWQEGLITHWGPDKMDAIFKWIFLNEDVWLSLKVSLKFVPKGPINNIPSLVHIMARRRPGDKPLSEPMVINLLTHICITWPQWDNQDPFYQDNMKSIC